MSSFPQLACAVELRRQRLLVEAARERDARRALAGTRTRGGSIDLALLLREQRAHLVLRQTRPAACA